MPVDPTQLSQDKDFLAANPDDQIKFLSSQDPDFAKAPRADQLGYLGHVTGKPVVQAPNAGLAPPPRPKFLGSGPTKEGSSAGQSPLITSAPEESGLETGPLVSHNPSENDTLTHGAGSARALARMIHSAGQALNPVTQIPAMFHAALDKPEDSQQATEEQAAVVPNVPPVLSRFVYRTMVKPAMNAVEDYGAGRVTPEAAANVAPEALGGAAGTVVGGKALESLIGAASAAAEKNGGFLPRSISPRSPIHDIVADTYSKAGDHLAASLRSNTKIDVPAETKIAAPAIEEGLNDRGIATRDFEGRNGPAALQAGIDNAIDIHEARAKSVIDPIRGEKVDPQILANNPELAARFVDKDGNLRNGITYGDLDAERIKMNKELRTLNFYSKPPSTQYAAADPLVNLHDAANQARDLVYDKAGQTTGVDLRPLKRTESALIKLGDLAETTKNTLSPKEAQFNTASLGSKIGGSVKGLVSAKANPVNAFSIPEKVGLSSPLNEFNANMRGAFPNLQAAMADRTVPFGYGHRGFNLDLSPPGNMPPPLQRIINLSGGENIPGETLKLTHPQGKTPPAPNTQEPLEFEGGQNIPAGAIPDILGRGLIGGPMELTAPGDMPPALQRVLGFTNPGVESEAYPGVVKVKELKK
jgi:hypothetical protein